MIGVDEKCSMVPYGAIHSLLQNFMAVDVRNHRLLQYKKMPVPSSQQSSLHNCVKCVKFKGGGIW